MKCLGHKAENQIRESGDFTKLKPIYEISPGKPAKQPQQRAPAPSNWTISLTLVVNVGKHVEKHVKKENSLKMHKEGQFHMRSPDFKASIKPYPFSEDFALLQWPFPPQHVLVASYSNYIWQPHRIIISAEQELDPLFSRAPNTLPCAK